MGRHHNNHHHHHHHHQHSIRLPEHLYLSSGSSPSAGAGVGGTASAASATTSLAPPPPAAAAAPAPPSRPKSFAASFLTLRSVAHPYYYSSPLDLLQETSGSACRVVTKKIPGFQTSAAFLTTLRANLAIELDLDSAPSSQVNTPDSLRPVNLASSTGSLPPPLPSPLVSDKEMSAAAATNPTTTTGDEHTAAVPASSNPLDGVPPLVTKLAVREDDRVDALKLVADSVAQQRQYGSRAMIFHPITAGVTVGLLAITYKLMHKGDRSDWVLVTTTLAGALMGFLVAVRYFTRLYIDEAERVGTWKWLDEGRGAAQQGSGEVIVDKEDDILLTRYGQEAVGALIMRGVRLSSDTATTSTTASSSKTEWKRSNSKKSRRQNGGHSHNNSRDGGAVTALIRGFTTTNRYRRRGIGSELLEEAVKICEAKGWQGPEFAANHANSARLLPLRTFDAPFEKRDRDARRLLERVKAEVGATTAICTNSRNSTGRGGKQKRRFV